MPFLKVHISSTEAPGNKPLLATRLREVMIKHLLISDKIGQVVVYEASPQLRAIHTDRCKNFVFIEVLMYTGRTAAMKQNLMKALVDEASRILSIDIIDINCCIQEIPQNDWFGGIS